jgi:hypothetical protein
MRIVVIVLLAAALLFVFPRRAPACSQCMCGTPFPVDLLGGVVPTRFTYGLEERYLSKDNALDGAPGMEQEREHRLAGFALWRPMNRLALLGRLPYNFKEVTTIPEGEAPSTERATGVGDAELLVLAGLAATQGPMPKAVLVILGITAPTGSNDKTNAAGDRLDAHLQPGAGAWSGTAGVNFALVRSRGVWDASLLGRVNGTSPHDYRYGNVLLYNAGFTSRGWKGLQFLAQVNGRSAKQDQLEDGSIGANTGGTVTYASPGLRWNTGVGLTVEGAVQVPFQQSLYGVQTEHTTGRLTVSMSR